MTLRSRVQALFQSRPGAWIDGRELARVGGYAAWRTRVGECRRLGMRIDNRVRRFPGLTISEYRWTPQAGAGDTRAVERGQGAAPYLDPIQKSAATLFSTHSRRVCEACGAEYVPARRAQRFCRHECRNAYHAMTRRTLLREAMTFRRQQLTPGHTG